MSVPRSAPLGAVYLFVATALGAAPLHRVPLTSAPAPAVAPAALQQAVLRLWQASPEVAAALAELDAAQARARSAAQPVYNPALSLEAENADVDRRTASLSLSLDLSGKRSARAGRAQAEVRASKASYNLLRRDVATRWLKAWSTAALAQKQSALGQRRLALMQRFDHLAARRLKVGDISSPERDLAGLALGEAQMQQATLVGNEASARAGLMALGGDPTASLPMLPAELSPPVESAPSTGVDALPEMDQVRAHQASAQAGVLVARRARVPDPTLSLTGGQVRSGPLNDRVISFSVSIPLPVLNSGRADVEAAQAEADAATAGVRARQFLARAGLQEAQARYTALREAGIGFRRSRAAPFDERTARLEKLWNAGETSTADYLVQLKQSLETALSGVSLESQAWQGWFDYLAAAGRLTDWLDSRTQETTQ